MTCHGQGLSAALVLAGLEPQLVLAGLVLVTACQGCPGFGTVGCSATCLQVLDQICTANTNDPKQLSLTFCLGAP